MKKIKHSKLPITLESADRLTPDLLHAIQLNLMYDERRKDNQSGWESWKDEYGDWFSPYKPNPNQLELFTED
jgi:hypothetical protein